MRGGNASILQGQENGGQCLPLQDRRGRGRIGRKKGIEEVDDDSSGTQENEEGDGNGRKGSNREERKMKKEEKKKEY